MNTLIIIVAVSAPIVALLAFLVGSQVAVMALKREAVKHGLAIWRPRNDGTAAVDFYWRANLPQRVELGDRYCADARRLHDALINLLDLATNGKPLDVKDPDTKIRFGVIRAAVAAHAELNPEEKS